MLILKGKYFELAAFIGPKERPVLCPGADWPGAGILVTTLGRGLGTQKICEHAAPGHALTSYPCPNTVPALSLLV